MVLENSQFFKKKGFLNADVTSSVFIVIWTMWLNGKETIIESHNSEIRNCWGKIRGNIRILPQQSHASISKTKIINQRQKLSRMWKIIVLVLCQRRPRIVCPPCVIIPLSTSRGDNLIVDRGSYILPPMCLDYGFNRWPILTYCTFNVRLSLTVWSHWTSFQLKLPHA